MIDTVFTILLLLFTSASGYLLGLEMGPNATYGWYGLAGGLVIALLAILTGELLKRSSLKALAGGLLGLIVFLTPANLFTYFFFLNLIEPLPAKLLSLALINVVFGYVGLIVGLHQAEGLSPEDLKLFSIRSGGTEGPKILDTSVIIDGRIADVVETGFVEGPVVIPQFVLRELQQIADSPESVRRGRGRRGLDILNRMREQMNVEVRVIDSDFPRLRDVDAKLVALAKKMGGKVVTNDFNLNKVAELQGIKVLNINDLANALRPVILPGEVMSVRVLKEGKEPGQGVAYLDDGTMVVVDNGIRHLGRTVEVSVTSVLQTAAGRMIFGKIKQEHPSEEAM